MNHRPIRVLVVDDSPTARELIAYVLASDPAIEVAAVAASGREAIEAVARDQPDAITMDILMPEGDGFEATRKIMETRPTPIAIVTASLLRNEVSTAFRALEAGALAVLSKPVGIGHPEYEARARELIQTVKLIAEIKLVRRWPKREKPHAAVMGEAKPRSGPGEPGVVAVGASTGGPVALQTLLSGLPKSFPWPILVVQHIAAGFTQGFVEWLGQTSGFPAHLARHGQALEAGRAYIAPEGLHMTVMSGGYIALGQEPASENGLKPSVSCLFRSVADVYGRRAIGILLTGMGKDGAEELKRMKDRGATTFAQDESSSVVHGMPGEAIQLGAVDHVLPPEKIAAALAAWAGLPHESP